MDYYSHERQHVCQLWPLRLPNVAHRALLALGARPPGVLQRSFGWHFKFQGAQRLAQGQLEEDCAQSEGRKWFAKFGKIDNKVVRPTMASQLATSCFKDLSLRLVIGILGSKWHGTRTCQHHIRTRFDDYPHGSNMQISAILMNLFDVATSEGYLPRGVQHRRR